MVSRRVIRNEQIKRELEKQQQAERAAREAAPKKPPSPKTKEVDDGAV